MASVTINVTTLGFSVKVSPKGELVEAPHLFIINYAHRLKNIQYNRQTERREVVGEFFHFDRDRQTCYFPRYDLDVFKQFLMDNGVHPDIRVIAPVQGDDVTFHMLPHIQFKNDKQKNAVEFLTNDASGPIRGLGLQTGTGKTVSVIMAMQIMGKRSLITMSSRMEQWCKEIMAYTTLDEDDLYIIQGVGSLNKLFSQLGKTLNPKIILASNKTIRNYLDYGPTYQHLPHPTEMCGLLGIGIRASDEAHEHFYTNFLMGLMFNPRVFIPITATFLASDPFVKAIFEKFIPKEVQFTGGEYDKYVSVTAYQYRAGQFIQPFHYMSPRGYSQQIFEKYLLGRGRKVLDPLVEDAFLPIIREHYIQIAEPGEKFLFLCSSTRLCDHLVNIFKRNFPDKKVTAFYSGIPESVLKEYDMILSTPGSSGTGRDIKGLRTCFVFESVDSETRNLQFIGRLRGPPQMMNVPEYVYLSFANIPPHARVHQKRALLLGSRAKVMKHRTIP